MTYPNVSLLSKIAEAIISAAPDGPCVFFLYVEAARNVCEPSLFQEYEDHALYIDLDWEQFSLIYELWNQADEKNKWGTMLYYLSDKQFTVEFDYNRRLDVEDDLHDYRGDALRERFGDKRILYPPFDLDEARRKAAEMGGDAFEL